MISWIFYRIHVKMLKNSKQQQPKLWQTKMVAPKQPINQIISLLPVVASTKVSVLTLHKWLQILIMNSSFEPLYTVYMDNQLIRLGCTVWVCHHFSMSPFWLSLFWSIAILVCCHFSMSPFCSLQCFRNAGCYNNNTHSVFVYAVFRWHRTVATWRQNRAPHPLWNRSSLTSSHR